MAGSKEFEVSRDKRREEALERLRTMRWKIPAWLPKFDREEAHQRPGALLRERGEKEFAAKR